jgi:hypothetical protein
LDDLQHDTARPEWKRWSLFMQMAADHATSVHGLDDFVRAHGTGVAPPGVLDTHL